MTDRLDELSLADLRFLLLADTLRSLSKAGDRLQLSPSAASRKLARVREILGDPCFVTSASGLVPTPGFERMRPIALDLLERAAKLRDHDFDASRCKRTWRLSCVMAEAAHFIGGILPRLLAQAPGIRLDCCKETYEFEAILEGRADFALVTEVDLAPDLHYMRLYPVERVVLMRREHPLARLTRALTADDLARAERVTILTGRQASWTGPDQNIFQNEKYLEHSRLTTTRFNLAWEAMQATDLICVCGFRAAEIAMRAYDLTWRALPAPLNDASPWNSLVWSERTHRDPSSAWFRSVCAEWAADEAKRMAALRESALAPR